ncbi:MAG: hypothetical protein AAF655_18480 [Bacteroidota bacterium]
MGKYYTIKGEEVPLPESPNFISLGKKGSIEKVSTRFSENDTFGEEEITSEVIRNLKLSIKDFFAPLREKEGRSNFKVAALISTLLSVPFIKWLGLNEPFVRGWRLEVVKQVALDAENPVPPSSSNTVFRYFFKGLFLIISRTIYFLPFVIITFLSGMGILGFISELFSYIMENFIGTSKVSLIEFLIEKLIIDAGKDFLIKLVLLGFYVVFVWPIYRIIMIHYALGIYREGAFFSISKIRAAVGMFKRHASVIYGVYALVISVDVIMIISSFIFTVFPLSLVSWIFLPTVFLIFRHWVKGHAYGILGKYLIANDEIQLS